MKIKPDWEWVYETMGKEVEAVGLDRYCHKKSKKKGWGVDRETCIVKNFAFSQIKYIYMLMRIMRLIGEKL